MKTIKEFFTSSGSYKISLWIIGGVIVALLIFQAGIFVGYEKAQFSYRLGDNYYSTFGARRGQFPGGMMGGGMMGGWGGDFVNSHGTIGKIIRIDLPTLVIEDQSGVEKMVLVSNDTLIKEFRDTIYQTDLKVDDYVVVIGTPNNSSQIEAKLIRLIPSGAMMLQGTTTPIRQ